MIKWFKSLFKKLEIGKEVCKDCDYCKGLGFHKGIGPTMYDPTTIKKRQTGIELSEEERDIYFDSLNTYSTWEKCYIKCSSQHNFLKLLPIDFVDHQDEIVKQWKWLSRLSYGLDRLLLPSVYGGQEDNFIDTYELNEFVNDLLIEDIKYYSEDCGEDADERADRILKTHNRNKALNQLGI